MALGLFTGLTADTAPTARLTDVYSVNFQGDDEYMTTTADGNLADKTYTFWAKSDATSATERNCVFAHGATSKGAFFFNWSSSRPLLYLGTSYYRFWATSSEQDDDAWHFYAVVVDVSDVTGSRLYIDGSLQSADTDATTSANVQAYGSLRIAEAGTEDFNGNIDEFCVFDGHLSAASVVELWNGGEPSDPNRVAQPGQLEHWWRMGDDGGSGGFIPDHANPGVGAELVTGFTNGSSYPLDTLVTSGRDITSAIETSGNWGGAASNAISVTAGEVYEVSFDLTYNSGTNPLRVVIAQSADGSAAHRSTPFTTNTSGRNTAYLLLTATDSAAHLQIGTGAHHDVINFSATDISCKLINGKPGYLYNGAVIQTDAP